MRSNLNAVIESAIMFDYLILMVMMIDGIDCGRYPYKPLYGLPSECLLEQHNRFDRCEVDAIKYYSLELDHFVSKIDDERHSLTNVDLYPSIPKLSHSVVLYGIHCIVNWM